MESGPHRGLPSSYLSRHGDGRAIPTHASPGRVRDRCSIIMFAYRGRIDSTSDMSHFADRQDGLRTMESGPHRGLPSSYLSRHGGGRAIPTHASPGHVRDRYSIMYAYRLLLARIDSTSDMSHFAYR
mgnify:CR=1 FL=1